jgi:hypothetical protein
MDRRVPLSSCKPFRDDNDEVVEAAGHTLAQIGRWPLGVQALIDSNAIYHVSKLFASPRRKVRETLRKLVETLAHHEHDEFTWLAILELKSSVRPFSLLL